ncbi:hypothetical protein QH494_19670 [Sphingomonas sp. AR_OL41]|uniref:hypothetical protein n=1 Tax=Sphingomonas sp. AR_OL41 TaxID=3042729 RepID=UPI002480B8D5|nr:hypothetical protein [Sphingomonas sp. AR_OL41]MDH7974415.1 hypothetical protein [Sphingomonas sp. AR_OL41]
MGWNRGRGLLGPLKPLIGDWATLRGAGDGPAAAMRCTRRFTPFGKDWIELDARWQVGPDREYREIALFGKGDDDALGCFSFTNDGKRSVGRLSVGSDVDPAAIAFEAQMPAGLARMIYWPRADDAPGFRFAVESRTKKGWNRFLLQEFGPA